MAKVEKTVYWCDNPDCPEYKKEHYAGSTRWGYSSTGEKKWLDQPDCSHCRKPVSYEDRLEEAPDISLAPGEGFSGSPFSSLDDAGKKQVLHKRYKEAYKREEGAARKEAVKKAIIKDTMNYRYR